MQTQSTKCLVFSPPFNSVLLCLQKNADGSSKQWQGFWGSQSHFAGGWEWGVGVGELTPLSHIKGKYVPYLGYPHTYFNLWTPFLRSRVHESANWFASADCVCWLQETWHKSESTLSSIIYNWKQHQAFIVAERLISWTCDSGSLCHMYAYSGRNTGPHNHIAESTPHPPATLPSGPL